RAGPARRPLDPAERPGDDRRRAVRAREGRDPRPAPRSGPLAEPVLALDGRPRVARLLAALELRRPRDHALDGREALPPPAAPYLRTRLADGRAEDGRDGAHPAVALPPREPDRGLPPRRLRARPLRLLPGLAAAPRIALAGPGGRARAGRR